MCRKSCQAGFEGENCEFGESRMCLGGGNRIDEESSVSNFRVDRAVIMPGKCIFCYGFVCFLKTCVRGIPKQSLIYCGFL